ncbi:potassium channel family protein [Flavobacterium sp. CLA17]|uniref:potassium channel family protein n=1 Tax=Flavobacterium sp. CLA17 TaxID=2724135 RepID=UPI00149229D1|nr:potassium channel family protein [Flavobacterium sp. CLA17]QSB26361.1 two pore domain potassium channel family protein [Flavobacterium sp. CLA17]
MIKPKENRFFYCFWIKESGLSGMLILLFIMHFIVIPLFGSRASFMVILNLFWMLLLLAGIYSLAKNKQQAIRISILPFLFIVCQWISMFNKSTVILVADFVLTIATLSLLIVLVLIKVFEPGPVTAYKIIGSIAVYMLLANLWCVAYLFLFEQIEGSFQLTPSQFKINSDQANFMYFSYVTITSTGFGEIVPLHPVARSLVQIEAFIGVLFPVILIGRLVSDANFFQNKE